MDPGEKKIPRSVIDIRRCDVGEYMVVVVRVEHSNCSIASVMIYVQGVRAMMQAKASFKFPFPKQSSEFPRTHFPTLIVPLIFTEY